MFFAALLAAPLCLALRRGIDAPSANISSSSAVNAVATADFVELEKIRTTTQAQVEWKKRKDAISVGRQRSQELLESLRTVETSLHGLQTFVRDNKLHVLLGGKMSLTSLQSLSDGELGKLKGLAHNVTELLVSLKKPVSEAGSLLQALLAASGLGDFIRKRQEEEKKLGVFGNTHLRMNKKRMVDSVPWIGDAWRKASVPQLESALHSASTVQDKLASVLERARTSEASVSEWVNDGFDDMSFWQKTKYAATRSWSMFGSFEAVGVSWNEAKAIAEEDVRQFVEKVGAVFESFADAAAKFRPGTISSKMCVSRGTRFFAPNLEVDHSTMSCYNGWLRKACFCKKHLAGNAADDFITGIEMGWSQLGFQHHAGEDLCYTDVWRRPAPKHIARCFVVSDSIA
eukprot:TRINITY_DN18732_c0_g2_i1.p1 TRINITY_DN18732_c0_g2~~TRINITY_DN18732_c0_g2_i1.p1  ORF type:complete len:401 (-),score=86.75 TRINITY_DN18732_c0_g2_i1:320-1522(-)